MVAKIPPRGQGDGGERGGVSGLGREEEGRGAGEAEGDGEEEEEEGEEEGEKTFCLARMLGPQQAC
jgi:hypothetical protein